MPFFPPRATTAVLISESLSLSFFLSYFPQFSPLVVLGLFQPLPGYLCVCARACGYNGVSGY